MKTNQAIQLANIAIQVGTPLISELIQKKQNGQVEISQEDIDDMQTRMTDWEDFTSFEDDYKKE